VKSLPDAVRVPRPRAGGPRAGVGHAGARYRRSAATGSRRPWRRRPRPEEDDAVRLAVIGRPNVGKSSLVNRLLGEERVIVSERAGTTRDAIDTRIEVDGREVVLVDTAGLRRRTKVAGTVDYYAQLRSERRCRARRRGDRRVRPRPKRLTSDDLRAAELCDAHGAAANDPRSQQVGHRRHRPGVRARACARPAAACGPSFVNRVGQDRPRRAASRLAKAIDPQPTLPASASPPAELNRFLADVNGGAPARRTCAASACASST